LNTLIILSYKVAN